MTYKNVLWIDPAVQDYKVFVNSVNEDTLAIVYPDPLDYRAERIGFVFELHGPMATYLLEHSDLLIGSGVKHMDFVACDTLPEWNSYYAKLENKITIGASNHQTGNPQYGGDWIMDSTGEDIERVYFTNSIHDYKYLLTNLTTYILKVGNTLWGIGDNTYQQLGITEAGPLTTFVNLSKDQTVLFQQKTIHDFHWSRRGTIVTMTDGTVWMAGYTNDQYIQSSTKQFVEVKLTVDLAGNKVIGKPILARLGQAGLPNDDLAYPKGSIWLITVLNNTYYLYIYCGDSSIQVTNKIYTLSRSNYFQLSNQGTTNQWTGETPLDPITNVYLGSYCSTVIVATSTNTYSHSYFSRFRDIGLLTESEFPYKMSKLRSVSTITKAAFNNTVRDAYLIHDGYLYMTDRSGYFVKCKSNNIDITGVTHVASTKSMVCIVTNNMSVWTMKGISPFEGGSNFKVYPYHFGLIKEVGIHLSGTTEVLSIYCNDGKVYDGSTRTVISTLETKPHVYTMDKTAASINSSVNLYIGNFNANNASYLYIGPTYTPISVISDTQLQFKVPNEPQANASINLYTSYGVIPVTTSFTIYPLGKIFRFNPSVVFPKQRLLLEGEYLYNISHVKFGTKSVLPLNVSTTRIVVHVPSGISDQESIEVVDLYNNVVTMTSLLDIINVRITSMDTSFAPRKSTLQLTGNFSNISAIRFGTQNTSFSWISQQNLSARVPEGIPLNCSIGVYDIYGNNMSFPKNFTDSTFTVSQFGPTTMFKEGIVDLSGSNFSNITEVRFGSLNASFTWNSSVKLVAQVPSVLTNCSIEVIDIYNNKFRYGSTFTITNLSFAFQVENTLTLVGTGLTGMNPGLPLLYNSSRAPMFVGKRQGTIELSNNGFTTDTVDIYPVTVIQTNQVKEEIVTVRGMPYGKIPDRFGVYYS